MNIQTVMSSMKADVGYVVGAQDGAVGGGASSINMWIRW
jgi:hypothetical protein